jgi:uncharacterized membrane protein
VLDPTDRVSLQRRARFYVQQLVYDLSTGLFARPATWTATLAATALLLPPLERAFAPELSALLSTEPGSAQVVLGTLAGSMMTVVSVVYSILLVALSLASVQFSTRILVSILRDRWAQHTLGLFLGTFVYCLLVLRSVHTDPAPYVPGLALTVAIVLALTSLAGLVWFIHHIATSIQANHLVERIAAATERVIDEVFPVLRRPGDAAEAPAAPPVPDGAVVVRSRRSGYVQLVDHEGLRAVAARGRQVFVLRAVGAFVAEGVPLLAIAPTALASDEAACLAAVDLGPVRTLQADVEYGFRQIVDIALKAISPAVNDPSTAATCIDHLGRLLVRVASRRPAPAWVDGVSLPITTHARLIDLAFLQLRQYGKTDMAVALRMMRVLGEVAPLMPEGEARRRVEEHAHLLETSVRAAFPAEDCGELDRRVQILRRCG